MKKNILLLLIVSFSFSISVVAQEHTNKQAAAEASKIATGNYKDIFNSFFQLGIDKLTSNTKEINFTSNPFAVMAKMDSNLYRDDNYFRYRHLRNLNINIAGKLDSSYRFNGFSAGIKYALVNKRDETVSRAFLADVLSDSMIIELQMLSNEMTRFVSTIQGIENKKKALSDFKKFKEGEINLDELEESLQEFIRNTISDKNLKLLQKEMTDPGFSFSKMAEKRYDDIKKYYNNKLLWTIGIHDTTYNNQSMFSNIVISTELVKGIVKPSAPCNVEINIQSAFQMTDDSTASTYLARQVFSFEPGLNLVLKAAQSQKSYLEFKLSAAYQRIFSKLYLNEKRDNFTLNGTLRFRVLNDIWIPIEFNYNPETGNVLGFLTVKANFTGITNLLGM